jgi:hypothetical protein
MSDGRWRRVTRSHPCPACGKPEWCSLSADGTLAACRRVEAGCWRSKMDRAGTPVYLHRLAGNPVPLAPPLPPPSGPAPDRANPDLLHRAYFALLAALPLSAVHREGLHRRGLTDAEIDRRGYRSLPVQGRARLARDLRERFGDAVLRVPGNIIREQSGRRYLTISGAAGLLVPVRDLAGRMVALLIRRDDSGNGPRYSYLSSTRYGGPGSGAPVHVPLGVTGPCQCVRVTEGVLKADIAHALTRLPTIGLPGVGHSRTALPLLRELGARTVRIAVDADAAYKATVARALAVLTEALTLDCYAVELERWPAPLKGIDDALAAGATVEVLTGAAARQAIADTLASAGAGAPPSSPAPVRRRRGNLTFALTWRPVA